MMSADYEVFLCHRGPDVKLNIVDVLHNALRDKGIKSFVDFEMTEGTDVHPAIQEALSMSKVHIVFLTPNFATSKWCLDELLVIMNIYNDQRDAGTSNISRKALLLPVFYDVAPSDVRYQASGSAYNLAEKIERSTAEQRAQWSKALKDLSFVKGLEYDTKKTHLSDAVKKIVSKVEVFLNETFPRVNVPGLRNSFAGQIDEVVKAYESSGSECKNVFSVGVYGPNEYVFAELLRDNHGGGFEARCSLNNVMDTASRSNGVDILIQNLYKDLVQKEHVHPRLSDARVDDLLQNKMCLVVLHDVGSDIQQIQPLLRILKEKLKKKSLVIFTSRFQHVLREMVKVDKFISLPGGEENKGYSLIIYYNKRDYVHPAFISHFQETFCMLGLDVCLLREDELVNCSRNLAKAQVIICIISKSSNIGNFKRTLVNASSNDEPKVLYLSYGPQSTIESTSSESVCLNVNFEESRGQPRTMEYKHVVEKVTDFAVGLLQRHKEIESGIVSHMSRSHRSVQCFGLWGMGGVGKTTTAKSIYNRMHKGFESSAFILDTRANAALSSSGLLNLQQKILDNLMPKESQGSNINDVDHGKRVLSSKLKGFNAFIVLDDLDTESQIEALCFPLSSLDPKSIVIITSRDRRILTYASIPEKNIFPIQGLREENSEWLFRWHAFMSPVPPAHLTEVSMEVIRACQGLPLSLKVLGSHLCGVRDINAWKESLTLIKQDEKNIFSILRVSLNSLNPSEKEAFLDICCFFIGREEDFVCAFLEGCYERGTTILIALKSKCLITVKSAIEYHLYGGRREVRTLQVHDQLRDMGRDIIQKEEKNRAWDEKTSNDILKDATAISGLRGLSARADMQYPRMVANYNSFLHLRFLELEKAQTNGQMNERMTLYNLFANAHCDELRWLTWRLPQELPPGLCSKQLRVLLLSNNGIRQLPGPLPNLRIVEVEGCWNLEGFSTAIATSMPLLWRLMLTKCGNRMRHLPLEIMNLRSLRQLSLESLEHMKTLSLPPNLRTLRLEWCGSLESVDGSLSNLEELKLRYCHKLTRFRVLGSSLVRLVIHACRELLLDDDECLKWKDFRSLRELTMDSLQHMKTLSLPPNLRMLTLGSCGSLESMDGSLSNLEELELLDCGKLKRFTVLGSSLVRLTIGGCPELLDDGECLKWKDLPSLRELTVKSQQHIKTLSLPPNLRTLRLENCGSLEGVDDSLPNLENLRLLRCHKLERLAMLGSSLVRLEIEDCGRVLEYDKCMELKDLPSLQELSLESLQHMKTFSLPPNLGTLRLQNCGSLESVDIFDPYKS